jgi:hypothetical protein
LGFQYAGNCTIKGRHQSSKGFEDGPYKPANLCLAVQDSDYPPRILWIRMENWDIIGMVQAHTGLSQRRSGFGESTLSLFQF